MFPVIILSSSPRTSKAKTMVYHNLTKIQCNTAHKVTAYYLAGVLLPQKLSAEARMLFSMRNFWQRFHKYFGENLSWVSRFLLSSFVKLIFGFVLKYERSVESFANISMW